MPSQRLTLVVVAGVTAESLSQLLGEWTKAWIPGDSKDCLSGHWPLEVRQKADKFADTLRVQGHEPPTVYFAQWIDMWSMYDTFDEWFTPADGVSTFAVWTDLRQVYGRTPAFNDEFANKISKSKRAQFAEGEWLKSRLKEATRAAQNYTVPSVMVLLREPFAGCVSGDEMSASFESFSPWLSNLANQGAK